MKKICLVFVWMVCVGMASSVSAQQIGYPYQGSGTAKAQEYASHLNAKSAACERASNKAHNGIETNKNIHRLSHVLTGRSIGGCQCREESGVVTCYVQYTYTLHPLK